MHKKMESKDEGQKAKGKQQPPVNSDSPANRPAKNEVQKPAIPKETLSDRLLRAPPGSQTLTKNLLTTLSQGPKAPNALAIPPKKKAAEDKIRAATVKKELLLRKAEVKRKATEQKAILDREKKRAKEEARDKKAEKKKEEREKRRKDAVTSDDTLR